MVRRQIDLDEESDRILSGLAPDYDGDLGEALADLLQAHQRVETFVEECEEAHRVRYSHKRSVLSAVSARDASQPGTKLSGATICDRPVLPREFRKYLRASARSAAERSALN